MLWERTAPDSLDCADWTWPDERLRQLRELGLRPIVGLVHHGSGPRSTSLLDARFPALLARYAGAVAERYPWVEDWTPVNEPLTTARFSALYGHWYPHARDDLSFVRALLNQCRAVVLAMDAIRGVVPNARLVQTDDLGKTHATDALAYQADYENVRRWLTFDLLCGRVRPGHSMWEWLLRAGIEQHALEWFLERPCPPDVVGINHYLSSERFLDERVGRYPERERGGNGRHAYADVLAARVLANGAAGPYALLREAWERYRLPVAVTEAHNGCTREEQLRWLDEVWRGASDLRDEGADVRAVTVWSLLGAYDWHEMCTTRDGVYEPGAFDVRSRQPRPTALAKMARALARDGRYEHPVLASPGWWTRRERLLYAPYPDGREVPQISVDGAPPLLVTGATGTLGRAFARACDARGLAFRLTRRADLDLADPTSVEAALERFRPWAVVNAAGYVRVDDAERDGERCFRENATGPAVLARACARRGLPLVTFSSDLVFGGDKDEPYVESDPVRPLGVYGRSKAEAEKRVLEALPSALVVRTSAFFGPWDAHNFVTLALTALEAGRPFAAADDLVVSPTYVPDLVEHALDLLIDGESGIWHLANAGATTWAELARAAAALAGVDASTLEPRPARELGFAAPRPRYSALASERAALTPPLEAALARYLRAREPVAA